MHLDYFNTNCNIQSKRESLKARLAMLEDEIRQESDNSDNSLAWIMDLNELLPLIEKAVTICQRREDVL